MPAASVAIEATNHFGLGDKFHASSSSLVESFDRKNIKDHKGNIECETMTNQRREYTTTYGYCNATPNIAGDLGAMLTAFGYLASGGTEKMFVTGMSINFRDGEYAEVTLNGVAYTAADMPAAATGLVANVAAAVPTGAGFGVPTLAGVTPGNNAAPSSMTINFSNNHVMAMDGTGDFFAGKNLTFVVEAEVEYTGVPTTYDPPTNWTTDSVTAADQNENFDTTSWSGHRNFDLT